MKSVAHLSAAVALLSGTTNAFWRMPCHERTALLRLDPIVDKGTASSHGHSIFGGSNFAETTTYDMLRASTCTSCQFGDDKSAYWTPSLHFVHKDGKTEIVPQVGGMLAYYLLLGDNIKAFPKGFQMVAGDSRLRNFTRPLPDPPTAEWTDEDKTQLALGQKAIGFNCMNYNRAPEGSRQRHVFPDKEFLDANCANGIRAEIMFPSCWNGKDVSSPDHRSHVAYPSFIDGGECPEGFPVRLPTLFYETIWNTYAFKGIEGMLSWANGDPTGCGYHADFIGGWDIDVLQRAVDTCTNPSGRVEDCPVFAGDLQSEAKQAECKIEKIPEMLRHEDCEGPTHGLCGNVPVQQGPEYAAPLIPGIGVASPNAPSPSPAAPSPSPAAPDYPAAPPPAAPASSSAPPPPPAPVANPPPQPKVDPAANPVIPAVAPALPLVTPAADIKDAKPNDDDDDIITTTTYTKEGVVYEVCIKEVEVTVTVMADDEPAPSPHLRRHAHRHRRNAGH